MDLFSIRLDKATKDRLEEIRARLQAEHDKQFGAAAMRIGIGQVVRLAVHQMIIADAKAQDNS